MTSQWTRCNGLIKIATDSRVAAVAETVQVSQAAVAGSGACGGRQGAVGSESRDCADHAPGL